MREYELKSGEACFRIAAELKFRLTVGVTTLRVKSNLREQKVEVSVDGRFLRKKRQRGFLFVLVFYCWGVSIHMVGHRG